MAWTFIIRAFGLQMSCCLSVVLRLFCFVLFHFCLFASNRAAALRSIVLRYACAPTATRSYLTSVWVIFCICLLFFFLLWRCRFFRVFLYHSLPFSLCMESTSYVFSFRMVFSYLVTTGWILDIRLCENSINQ